MVTIIFYEKPGCINNTKQKVLLISSGHTVEAHSLLTTSWTAETLLQFFGDRPIVEWFNPSAPAIKSGNIIPATIDAETALTQMIQDPLLIRRPLIQVGEQRMVGFDIPAVDEWIGLHTNDSNNQENSKSQDLQTCPKSHSLNTGCQSHSSTVPQTLDD